MVELMALASGMFFIWWLAAWLACAFFAGHVAEQKGRCAACWVIWGLAFGPLALIATVGLTDRNRAPGHPHPRTHVTCPECIGLVHKDASKCQHCGTRLVLVGVSTSNGDSPPQSLSGSWGERVSSPGFRAGIIVLVLVLAAIVLINRESGPVASSPPAPMSNP